MKAISHPFSKHTDIVMLGIGLALPVFRQTRNVLNQEDLVIAGKNNSTGGSNTPVVPGQPHIVHALHASMTNGATGLSWMENLPQCKLTSVTCFGIGSSLKSGSRFFHLSPLGRHRNIGRVDYIYQRGSHRLS